jgi:pyrroline-5-carboxylate reductase
MPSPVCRSGRGLTALSFDRRVTNTERARVRKFLTRVGQAMEVPERKFDAFTVTYSSSHGYHALATLAEAAQRAGLDRGTALTAAAHALADGIIYWRESGLMLADLLQEAATPGGIAAATMSAMDRAGFQRAVEKGLAAGIQRARGNAKG